MSPNKKPAGLTVPGLLPAALIILLCTLVLVASDKLTQGRIDINRLQTTVNMIEALMPAAHDNNMYADRIQVPGLSTTAYRARRGDNNVGLVLMPIAARGYNGNISLAIGIAIDGTLFGVRVIEHGETPGLGDAIDEDVSDWVNNFIGRSLANTKAPGWAVESDGGEFDGISGATISPRNVINAVHSALEYYQLHTQELYREIP